jgi:hypothetical protein
MNRTATKTAAALATGCLLALLTAIPARAAFSDEEAAPAGDATTEQTRFYLYGVEYLRAGERLVYLGDFDSARAARRAGDASAYRDVRVAEGVGLTLPLADAGWPSGAIRVYRRSKGEPLPSPVGEFHTPREAAAAAEAVLADGDKFEVMYGY